MTAVLIETLWNVKETGEIIVKLIRKRINRNIVECKGHKCFQFAGRSLVLIETLWNVKLMLRASPDANGTVY